jgi:hypothetical protein
MVEENVEAVGCLSKDSAKDDVYCQQVGVRAQIQIFWQRKTY